MTKQELQDKLDEANVRLDLATAMLKHVAKLRPDVYDELFSEFTVEIKVKNKMKHSSPLPKNTTQKPDASGPLQAPPPGGTRGK